MTGTQKAAPAVGCCLFCARPVPGWWSHTGRGDVAPAHGLRSGTCLANGTPRIPRDGHAPPIEHRVLMMCRISSARVFCTCLTLRIQALTACLPVHAQSNDAADRELDIEDRWALQFRVNNLLDLDLAGFQGALISAKKQYSGRRAFRFGLGFDASISRQNTEQEGPPSAGI